MADITDGTSNSVFVGEHTSSLSDKTWVGVVPYSVTCKKVKGTLTDDCDSDGNWQDAAEDLDGFIRQQPPHAHSH